MRTQLYAKGKGVPQRNYFSSIKILLLFFLYFSGINLLSSQFSIGSKLNYSNSKILENQAFVEGVEMENQWKSSIGFGLIAKYSFNEIFSLKTELLFVKKGTKRFVSKPDLQLEGNSQTTFRYVEIPILAELSIPINRMRIYGDIGPSIAFWRNAYESGKIDFCNTIHEFDRVIRFNNDGKYVNNNHVQYWKESEHNRFDLLLNAGVGVSIESNGGLQLFAETRYSKGMVSYYKGNSEDALEIDKKHIGVNFSVGFTQRLGM